MTTGVAPPRPREGWTNLVANDSMPARDSGLMVAPRTPAKVGGAFGADDNDTGI